MKSKNLIAVFFLLISASAAAQEDQTFKNNSDFFSLNLSMGLTGNVNSQNINTSNNPGFNFNIDLSNTPVKEAGFFINYSSAYFSAYRKTYPDMIPYLKDINYTQITAGPRFYTGNKNSFIDVGIGYSNMEGDEVFGASVGLGGRFRITDIYAVSLTGRVNASDLFNDAYINYSLNAGLDLRNNSEVAGKKSNTYKGVFSLAALAGSNGSKYYYKGGNSFGGELSYGVGKNTTLLINYIYTKKFENFYQTANQKIKFSQSEFTGGVRYYVYGDNLKIFIEGLTGGYFVGKDYSGDFQGSRNYSYFGLTAGGGVEINLIDQLSGLIRLDVSNYFSNLSSRDFLGNSNLGLLGGLKYNL
ncbi:MAG: hypothetical protein KDD00_09340 [Ignavibacteriae bacterium]|nr:hypothetical protein [Ignavibacteriota bacterium]